LGVLELSVLPSIDEECWVPAVQETDALLVWGGDPVFLSYWMRRSGLADILPSLPSETVYVGVSAGSIATTPYNCDAEWNLRFVPRVATWRSGRADDGAGRLRVVGAPP
jgi:dipeptidase E